MRAASLEQAPSPSDLSTADLIEAITLARRSNSTDLPALYRELVKRRPPPVAPRARSPLEAARQAADVLRFEVPPSHRKKWGELITGAKRLTVAAVAPLEREVLRTQCAFNHALLEVLEAILREDSPNVEWRLRPLADPAEWSPTTHLRGIAAKVVLRAKAAWLRTSHPLWRPILDRQKKWNEHAIELATLAARGEIPPIEEANRRIGDLAALCDPLEIRAPWTRALAPLLREIFRKQNRFNTEVMLVLSDLLHGRPPVVPPTQAEYRAFYEAREPQEIAASAAALKTLTSRPLISLVVPAWETPEPILRQCVESVRAQLYDRWELCVVDDGSKSRRVREVLEAYAKKDARIRWTRLERNGGIARATNAAIELARGEWIAFLDHDDVLAPHALSEMALRIATEPGVDWLYSDEDRITNDGVRLNPFYKPDYSPDLLRSVNYICHFVVARADLVKALRIREGFEGSQDFDFLLRLSEQSERVAHVPKILYHWRTSPISLSHDDEKLKAASRAGIRALQEHLSRKGESGEVTDPAPTNYRIRYPVRGEPLVSIIIPFKDRPDLLERLMPSLLEKTRYRKFEVLLVSNESRDPKTFAYLDRLTDPRVRRLEWNHPFHYPRLNNWAAKQAKGELLLFLNNDMEVVDPFWLEELIGHAQRPEVAMVGPKLLFPDGSIQHAGVVVGLCGYAGHPFWRFPNDQRWTPFGHADWNRNYLAVTSACVLLRREEFEALGGFDERFRVCGSDVDLGLRAVRRGKRVVYTAGTWLYHHESASRRTTPIPEDDHWESVVAYRDILERGDPFYNPNLTLSTTQADLRTEKVANALELALEPLSAFAAAHLQNA
ncbi:MAG: glycosyltransferase family 2 protein [Myxococcaceae bacterium]|nr:glycosyltransferase family 2 protein [Myxococcaceae bacterium]